MGVCFLKSNFDHNIMHNIFLEPWVNSNTRFVFFALGFWKEFSIMNGTSSFKSRDPFSKQLVSLFSVVGIVDYYKSFLDFLEGR